jgi:hypothetical protein
MSLRAAALGFRRRSNLGFCEEIASGKEQKRPRKDTPKLGVKELIFFRTLIQNKKTSRRFLQDVFDLNLIFQEKVYGPHFISIANGISDITPCCPSV